MNLQDSTQLMPAPMSAPGAFPQNASLLASGPASGSAPTADTTSAPYREELEYYNNLIEVGELRSAIHALHRELERAKARGNRNAVAHVGILLARNYAHLGYFDDATELLQMSRRSLGDRPEKSQLLAFELGQIDIMVRKGKYAAAVRLGLQVTAQYRRHECRPQQATFDEIHCLIARAYLWMGRPVDAQRTVEAVLKQPVDGVQYTRCMAYLILGDALFAELMHDSTRRRLQEEQPPRSREDLHADTLARHAGQAYAAAADIAGSFKQLQLAAAAGAAKSRLVRAITYSDLELIESHVDWLSRTGLWQERDREKVAIAFVYLHHGSHHLSSGWSKTVALAALRMETLPVVNEALLMFAASCHMLADERTAFRYLQEYLNRVTTLANEIATPIVAVDTSAAANGAESEDELASSGSKMSEIVNEAIAAVQENMFQHIPIGQLASKVGVSRRSLEYAFQRTTGSSPKRHIDGLRLNEARNSIMHSDGVPKRRHARARQVAKDLGFASYRVFVRSFSRTFGMSPAEAIGSAGTHAEQDETERDPG